MSAGDTRVVAIDADALVGFTRQLVRIPSVYDPAHGRSEQPAAELVEARMRAFGWSPTVDIVADGRPNVIATIDGDRPGRTLLFEGHTDVVTEGDEDAWSVDPFGAELREGRIYGRGSADMKSGVAAMLFAADAVVRSGSFAGRLVVAALVDEEGMMSGVRDFVAPGTCRRDRWGDLLRARGRRDLSRCQGRLAAAGRPHRQDGPRGDAIRGAQPQPGRRGRHRRPHKLGAPATHHSR